jgi:hypothetical protein
VVPRARAPECVLPPSARGIASGVSRRGSCWRRRCQPAPRRQATGLGTTDAVPARSGARSQEAARLCAAPLSRHAAQAWLMAAAGPRANTRGRWLRRAEAGTPRRRTTYVFSRDGPGRDATTLPQSWFRRTRPEMAAQNLAVRGDRGLGRDGGSPTDCIGIGSRRLQRRRCAAEGLSRWIGPRAQGRLVFEPCAVQRAWRSIETAVP